MGWGRFWRLIEAYPLPSTKVTRSIPAERETVCLRSRMREFRTSGSVGAPGGKPPGATWLLTVT
jgi:hypothetical protein